MKKFLVLMAFLSASSVLLAQWQFGARGGFNYSTMSGENGYDSYYYTETGQAWIPGRVIGGVASYSLNDNFSLVAEFLNINTGAKYKYEDTYGEGSRSINSTYQGYWKEVFSALQIPILAKYTFGKNIQYYGDLGPYFSYLLSGRYRDVIQDLDYDQTGKIKFKPWPDGYQGDDQYYDPKYYNRIDVGMYFGVGGQRELGSGILAIDLRFGLGFLDFNKFPDNDKPDGYKPYKNRNISISVAYMFKVDKK